MELNNPESENSTIDPMSNNSSEPADTISSTPSRPKGLSETEVEESRQKYGSNILTPPERVPWWKRFGAKFADPLIIILLIAGVLAVGIAFYEYFGLHQGWKVFFEPVGIFVAIALATVLAFIFEEKANKAFRILNQVNDDEPVEVMRGGGVTTVPRKDIVVGDIVILSAGSEIPADGELLEAISMSVDESSLTGEPLCTKTTDPSHFDSDATYPSNHVLRGTKVMEGHGVMRVEKVGDATEMGKVYEESRIDDSIKTPLNEQLDKLGGWITEISYLIAGLIIVCQMMHFLGFGNWESWLPAATIAVFFWLVIKKFKDWSKITCLITIAIFFLLFIGFAAAGFAILNPEAESAEWTLFLSHVLTAIMVAVTLIVVAVPEGLPMAVTLSLAYSMSRMLKNNNLVRRMHACETMGATTVICTDKTGTLTQNRMQVYSADFFGNPAEDLIFNGIAVNSTAQLDFSEAKPKVIGNPTEGALLLWLSEKGKDYRDLRADAVIESEIPFSTERKYMATVVADKTTGKRILYVKGAPEIVFALCSETPGVTAEEIDRLLRGYQNQAMRTLGFAYRELTPGERGIDSNSLSSEDLTFLGIVAISDPVREEVPGAVGEVRNAGIEIKIVTGDTPGTAKEIGREIGLWDDAADSAEHIITGTEFAALSDSELDERVKDIRIIARARPMDKKRLVEALQRKNEVVAVTGDGTNDAPALKAAHVGLSMGDGTSVAKEASDITIIDNSFSSIGRAVMWGRSLYKNIQRFLLFQLTVNVAACLLVLVGSFIATDSPLSITQMLWVNLIMDTFGAMALASLPPSPKVMEEPPRKRSAFILTGPMVWELVGVGTIFFIITFAFYFLFDHADVTSIPQMFHAPHLPYHAMTPYESTLLFSIFVWTHFWYMFNARCFDTDKSVFKVKMSQGFITIVWVIVIGQLFITEIAYEFFNVSPMIHTLDWKFNPSGTLDLLIIVAASSLVVWTRELYRLLTPRH